MKHKTILVNSPTEIEVIDAVPTLCKIFLDSSKPPLSVNITYLGEFKGKFLINF